MIDQWLDCIAYRDCRYIVIMIDWLWLWWLYDDLVMMIIVLDYCDWWYDLIDLSYQIYAWFMISANVWFACMMMIVEPDQIGNRLSDRLIVWWFAILARLLIDRLLPVTWLWCQ